VLIGSWAGSLFGIGGGQIAIGEKVSLMLSERDSRFKASAWEICLAWDIVLRAIRKTTQLSAGPMYRGWG
jgi:hypothetical protein